MKIEKTVKWMLELNQEEMNDLCTIVTYFIRSHPEEELDNTVGDLAQKIREVARQ